MNILTTGIVYERKKKVKPLKLSNGLYKIETIPVGSWVKDNAKSGEQHERMPFEVDDALLSHWKETFNEMMQNGIEVPMPLDHTEDPEKRRATVVDFEISKNKEGKNTLYTIFKPRDESVIKELKDTSVSIYSPPKFVDGNGNEYHRPIRHVCFTDYPVIPGMSKMQKIDSGYLPEGAIAASYIETGTVKNSTSKKGKEPMAKMPVRNEDEDEEIKDEEGHDNEEKEEDEQTEEGEGQSKEVNAENLRIVLAKITGDEGNWGDVPDDKLIPALEHILDAIMEGEDQEEEGEAAGGTGKEEGKRVASRIEHKEEHYHPPSPGGNNNMNGVKEQPIAAGFINRERKNRIAEINRLAEDAYINVPQRDTLIKKHCSDEALELALSHNFDILDNFDQDIELIKMGGKRYGKRESSQNDSLVLSNSDLTTVKNPLIANAEARAKQAGQG